MGFRCPECKEDFGKDKDSFDFHIKNEHDGKGNAFIFLISQTIKDSLGEHDTVEGICRVCGCTDNDCSQCIEAQGFPCHWIEPDLCSRCSHE